MHYRNYRIPDEEQLFEVGDKALMNGGEVVTIDRVHVHNVYYEARPIAMYTAYQYSVLDENDNRHYVETKDLSPLQEA